MPFLPGGRFGLDVRGMRAGLYSDAYFVNTARVLARTPALRDRHVTVQVFAKEEGAVLCGMSEALAILQEGSVAYCERGHVLLEDPAGDACTKCGAPVRFPELTFYHLDDGDRIGAREPVLHIEGRFLHFAHLETVYLGALARGTRVATNVGRAVEAARAGGVQKPLFFFPARHDHWGTQAADGYAAHIAGLAAGGPVSVSTEVQASWWGGEAKGTMPHALIAVAGGDTVEAALALAEAVWLEQGPDARVVALVDYHNDTVGTSLAVARAFRERFGPGRLWGVRCDTSETVVDRALLEDTARLGADLPTGVNPLLVALLRERLDAEGFTDVHILVSGGFTAERIRRFETSKVDRHGRVLPLAHPEEGLPVRVDGYGVGEALLARSIPFTADVVRVEGRDEAKVGRSFMQNPRLKRTVWRRRP